MKTKEKEKKLTWKELPSGDYLAAGTAEKFCTGDWRTERPIWDSTKCISCMFCWIACPDSSILVKDGKMIGIDFDHCKGCGICSVECPVKPVKAIVMGPERK